MGFWESIKRRFTKREPTYDVKIPTSRQREEGYRYENGTLIPPPKKTSISGMKTIAPEVSKIIKPSATTRTHSSIKNKQLAQKKSTSEITKDLVDTSITEHERMELATARAKKSGLPPEEMPVMKEGKIISQSEYDIEQYQRGLNAKRIAQQNLMAEEMKRRGIEEYGFGAPPSIAPEGIVITTISGDKVDATKTEVMGTYPVLFTDATGVTKTIDMPFTEEEVEASRTEGVGNFLKMASLGLGSSLGSSVNMRPAFWQVKLGGEWGKGLFTSKKAVQIGTSVSMKAKVGATIKNLFTFKGMMGAVGAVTIFEKIADSLTPRKIDEQQTALNTLGQMATTIGGQATEGTGDWRMGLAELKYLKSEILKMEQMIKLGTISNYTIRLNGKIYDLNADVSDQLATIEEQITIIQNFAVSQSFPEADEITIQATIRQLEEEGYIKPMDLTTSRRPIGEV